MPIILDTDLNNAFHNQERYSAGFFTFTLGVNTYGLWTGAGDLSYNGLTYRNGGSLIQLEDIQQNADGSVSEMSMSMSAQPDKGLTFDLMQSFYDEDWQWGRVVLQLAMIHPTTGVPIGAITLFRGTIIEAPSKEGLSRESIELRVSSASIRLSEAGGSYRNAATQKKIDPDDSSLNEIGSLGGATKKDFFWNQGSGSNTKGDGSVLVGTE